MAFQSIKKLQPDSCPCMEYQMLEGIRKKFSKRGAPLPKGYLEFVRKKVKAMFPKGWDRSYLKFCETLSPPLSACEGTGRAQGGVLGSGLDHSSVLDICYGRTEFDPSKPGRDLCSDGILMADGTTRYRKRDRVTCQALVVQSAGKPRPLTKFPAETLALKPLHKTIYGWLSSKPWLLRGEITDERLKRAGFSMEKGMLVSGDYASATDNLPIEVVEVILEVLQKNAMFVPASIFKFAGEVIRPIAWCLEPGAPGTCAAAAADWEIEVVRGQMMGSVLSFPMLCLQNYLGLAWTCHVWRREMPPVLINGDDIIFQTPERSFVDRWMETVKDLGLEVEPTKTSVDYSYGSLNSTLIRWDEVTEYAKVVKTLRFGMLRRSENPTSLPASFYSFLGKPGDLPAGVRWRAACAWFSWHAVEMRDLSGCGYYPDELGFRGRLAFRLCEKYKLFRNRDPHDIIREPPVPVLGHNVALPPGECTIVNRGDYGEEFRMDIARSTASWKWGVEFEEVKVGQVNWALQLSCPARWRVRPDSLTDAIWQLSPGRIDRRLAREPDRVVWRRRFQRPWVKKELWPVLDIALIEQLCQEFEPLPPYQRAEEDLFMEETRGKGAQKEVEARGEMTEGTRLGPPDVVW